MTTGQDSSIEVTDPFARRLLAKYLERRRTDLTDLRAALSQNDFHSIQRTGHNLYGSGATYGLEQISTLGADLEEAAKNEDGRRIAAILDALAAFVDQVTVTP